jgi:hypothetical protein
MNTGFLIFGGALAAALYVTFRHCERSWQILAAQQELDDITARRRELRQKRKSKAPATGARGQSSKLREKKADLAAATKASKES